MSVWHLQIHIHLQVETRTWITIQPLMQLKHHVLLVMLNQLSWCGMTLFVLQIVLVEKNLAGFWHDYEALLMKWPLQLLVGVGLQLIQMFQANEQVLMQVPAQFVQLLPARENPFLSLHKLWVQTRNHHQTPTQLWVILFSSFLFKLRV